MAECLKLGAVGIGNAWKALHSKTLLEHPEVEILGVCDIRPERAESFARQHGIRHVCTDFKHLLALPSLDAIDICTPNVSHSEIALAALTAGKHVFTEKPEAIDPISARRMADAARQNGKVLMAMRNNRFGPAIQFLWKYVESGQLGEVYTGRCGWIRRRGIPGSGGWFTTREESGGGPLIDLGIHMIDLATWLMGNPVPAAVTGATYCKFAGTSLSDSAHSDFGERRSEGTFNVEDLATGFVRFQNQATLQIECSWASNIQEEQNFVELRGTKGGFSWRNGQLTIFTEIEGTLCDIIPKTPPPDGAHGRNLHHFIDVVRGRAKPIWQSEQGIRVLEILHALYESAGTGCEVSMGSRALSR